MDSRTIIKSLRIENYGCFRNKLVEFGPGFNQIVGANESGKSTIAKALFTVLFEDGSTKKKAVNAGSNWKTNQSFRLTLEFNVGTKEFSLIRDYGSGRDMMTDSDGLIYEGKAIDEKLALYFITSDRNLFESIFCFSSDNPSAPESSKDRLKSAIETPVFYGFDRGRADRFLDEEIKKLDNPRAHGPREIDLISDQISGRLQEKSELEKRIESLDGDRKELDDVRERLEEHENAINRLDKEFEGASAYQDVNNRMVSLEERLHLHLGNYSRAAQVSEDLERVEGELNRLEAPTGEEIEAMSLDRDGLNSEVDQSKSVMDNLIVRRKKANRGFAAASLILVLLCLTYVFMQNGYISSGPISDILPYSIPVMALVWLTRMGVYLAQFYRKKKATADFRESVSKLDTFYERLNQKYDLKAADPVKVLEETVQRRMALEISAENLRETIKALSEGKGVDYLNAVREQIEIEVSQMNLELAPLAEFAGLSDKLPSIKEELISRRVRANALRERSALLTERCSVITTLQAKITGVEEEVEILKRKHNDISERLEVLKITRNALNRAADQLIEDTFEAYGASSSTFLTRLTNGGYDRLRFDRQAGRFEVKVTATDRWHEISEVFSSSTRDCFYLAIRLAGIALLSSEFIPPIILDQAESRMDKARQQAFYELMAHNAAKRQIIYIGLEPVREIGDSHMIELVASQSEIQSSSPA